MLSRLSHANIAGTHEYGTDDEQHFIAMELLVGRKEVHDAADGLKHAAVLLSE